MVVRTAELKKLEELYQEGGDKLVLLAGNVFAGTDALIRQFTRDKEFFYANLIDASFEEQNRQFLYDIKTRFNLKNPPSSFPEAFSRLRGRGKIVFILDNMQNSLKEGKDFWLQLVKAKRSGIFGGNVLTIVVFNELSHLTRDENYLPDEKKDIDERIILGDVPFLDIVRAFPSYSVSDDVRAYGILGGNQFLINLWSGKRSLKENVINTMLNPYGPARDAANRLLSSELRELSVYQTILLSMARGNEKLNDLFTDTGFSRAKIIVYLKNLEAFGIVEKIVSFDTGGWENSRKGIYRIKNQYINFYFKFIYPNLSELFMEGPEMFFDQEIEPGLNDYLDMTFSGVCREYLTLLAFMGKTPVKIVRSGVWIGKEGTIDYIGQDEARNNIVAKTYFSRPLRYSDYEELLDSMKKARIKARAIYLFSATDFDDRLKELSARDSSIILVDMKEL